MVGFSTPVFRSGFQLEQVLSRTTIHMCKAVCVKRVKQQESDYTKLIITFLEVAIKRLFSSSSFFDVTQHQKW